MFLKLQGDERNMRIMECGECDIDGSCSDNSSDGSHDDVKPGPRKLTNKR